MTCFIAVHLLLAGKLVSIPYDSIDNVRPYLHVHSSIKLMHSSSRELFSETEDEIYEQMRECWERDLEPFYSFLDEMEGE